MPITRKFIDWSQPALPAAAEFLLETYVRGGVFNLEDVVIVVPGGRAGRRLMEILVQFADERSLIFFPPHVEPMGTLPERLYESKRPFAGELVQQLAWVHALRGIGAEQLVQVIPQLPADDDVLRWMDLGALLWQQHRELAADAMDFAHVARAGHSLDGFRETDRWNLLSKIQQQYLQILDHHQLWDLQTARLYAIEHGECRTDCDIVLVGTADMNQAMRRMLDQVASRVVSLIFAPPELADHFDEHGCLLPEAWQHAPLEVATEQVHVVDGPADVADAVVRAIAGFNGRYRADEITIGVPDEQAVPQIQRQLLQCGVPSRWVVGKSLPDTTPYRLLEALANFADRGRYADFAALVRHPDVFDWIERQRIGGDWLSELDEYYNEHLQPRLGDWLGDEQKFHNIQKIQAALEQATEPLTGAPRKLGEWAPRIVKALSQFYGDVELIREGASDHYTLAACQKIRAALLEHQAAPQPLAPMVTATEAIRLVLEELRSAQIPPLADEDAVELLGWLELPLDTAPALVVASFNEGFVPKSVNSDLFLPNGLRQRLGLMDNARRYARDAYALSMLLASRKDLTLIVGRRDEDGNPLVPSRLLLAADRETIARRAIEFFEPHVSPRVPPPLPGAPVAKLEHSDFVVRKPPPLQEPVRDMSVTAFRSYLACPYRFYLRHVLKLEPLNDEAEELGAATFGNLIHEVLRQFGSQDIRHSTDAAEIRHFLRDAMNQHVDLWFGRELLPAVNVQIMQLRLRLDAFADWQARWAGDGWQIQHTETSQQREPVQLHAEPGQSITLHGRIDRIDRHAVSGQWAIFDYKTSDTAKKPEQAHQRGGEWIDLQLPLYRHLARPLGVTEPLKLGYIVLPKDTTKVGELLAEWSDEDLAAADEEAINVVRGVLQEEFWPPTYPAPNILTDFAVICQDGAFEKRIEGSTE
jgi:ATP-dependent helicase/nuclease subunit B